MSGGRFLWPAVLGADCGDELDASDRWQLFLKVGQ